MANAMVALATTTLGSTASSITFGSIPSIYRDLRLVINATTTNAGQQYLVPRVNGDTGANYNRVIMYGDGSSAVSIANSNQTSIDLGQGFQNTGPANTFFDFLDYAATDKHKSILARSDAAQASTNGALAGAYRWASTSAISSIAVICTGTFAVGSSFSLYGIVSA